MNKARSQVKRSKQLKVSKSPASIRCLVTGFDAFKGNPFNPSEIIAQSMPEKMHLARTKTTIPIQSLALPTAGRKAWVLMRSALKAISRSRQPSVIIMLGLASKRKNICLERFALNIQDAPIKDNAGHSYRGQTIDKQAPEALRTNTSLEEIQKYLKNKSINVEISNFGGTFVCNEIYFRTLQFFKKSRIPHSIIFIHLPLPSSHKKKSAQLSSTRSIIMKIIEFNCLLLHKQKK